MTKSRKETMVGRWRGILGRLDDGVAPGQGYRDFVSYFGIPVSEFPLTYRCDELIDEVSVPARSPENRRELGRMS